MGGFLQLRQAHLEVLRLYATASVMLFALLALPLSLRSETQELILPGATVVLMTGLPGDIESETAYRDQIQSWVKIVAAEARAQQLIVLCDAPDSISLPPKPAGKVLKADRASFLQLTNTLAGTTNPVLFIAWGHGGRQGSVPVFHVRGPRVSAADFESLAAAAPKAESRWILLFRGSGGMASQIAGPGRQVLSSDAETMFNNDPVAMALLLNLVSANPKSSFARLAEKLGQATAGWFGERHLARTEDPTLWLDKEQPKLLAKDSEQEQPEAAKEAPADRHTQPNEAQPGELPPSWKDIVRMDRSKFPRQDAVILQRRLSYTLGNAPAVTCQQEQFIQVLTPEGKRFGDFDISYAPPFEEIDLQDCEVLRPDGRLVRLDPEGIREERPETLGDYDPGHRKFFSLPNVVPGAVLHVRYRTEWQKFPLPQISMAIPLSEELPAIETTIRVSLPKEASFHFALEQVSGSDPGIQQSSYGTTYSWQFKNLPARLREPLRSPGHGARLMISTFPDWPAFAEWYSRISKLTDEVTPEIQSKAAELTRDAKTERERVMALYNFVTGLRYVAVPLGVNSFRPHAAENVLRNQFGDCKDKANLLNALLHAINIPADLVLLPRFSQAYDNLPGFAFNHAISRVMLEGQPVWLDSTDDVCRFGLLPPGDPGRKVLVVESKIAGLTQLPLAQPQDHWLELKASIDCTHPLEPLPIKLSARTKGYPDYELRTVARAANEEGASVPIISARLHPVAGAFGLQEQSATDVSVLEQDFEAKAEGTWVGGVAVSARKCVLHSPFWTPKEWDLALHRRTSPLFLNQGYPLRLQEEFELNLASGSQCDDLPAPSQNQAPPLQWRTEWARVGHDKVSATFRAEVVRGELSMDETAEFQKQLRQLLAALGGGATLSLPP